MLSNKNRFIKKSSSKILFNMVGKSFKIYQGKRFIVVHVLDTMVGKYFGEFIRSRKRHVYKKK